MNMSLSVPTWAIPNLPTTSRMADQPTISSIEEWMHFFVVKTTILNVFKLPKTTRKKKTNVQAFPQYCDIRTSVATTIGA